MSSSIDSITQFWVQKTGQAVGEGFTWLEGPIGSTNKIGDEVISELEREHKVSRLPSSTKTGLIKNFGSVIKGLHQGEHAKSEIIDFYENTSSYSMEVWSKWIFPFAFGGKLISKVFAERLQQLNLPLDPLDSSYGIESQVIQLSDESGEPKFTFWYRVLRKTGRVIYSGAYSVLQPPDTHFAAIKVVFPLPNGSATVVLRVVVEPDGSVDLRSQGKAFGDPGFYFILKNGGQWYGKYVKQLHENIRVFVDKTGCLRADHNLYLFGLPFLKLHYKMTKTVA